MTILVTGGAGFIGTYFILSWLAEETETIINVDKLSYAGSQINLNSCQNNKQHIFIKGDIRQAALITKLLAQYQPRAIINFAAESHVDRSIKNPQIFIDSNIMGVFNLLEASRQYWLSLSAAAQANFRFMQISTDEVYGTLKADEKPFTEAHPYAQNSPYSASKASADHLVRAYHHTYALPTLVTNCSNNYGPYQFPEKLIPLMIDQALAGKKLPNYGDGQQIRDWLFVLDHCRALKTVLKKGKIGNSYNIGGNNEYSNLAIVELICS